MSQQQPKSGLQSFKEQKLASDIENIHRALVVDAEVKKIPEGTFVKEILPILTGDVVSTEFPLLMAAVAGSPFSEIDVCDAEGNVLFRMPALLERNIFSRAQAERRGSLASMMITVGMLSHQSPKRAEMYLEHEFNGRGIASNREELIKKRQERWNAILARYGKSLKLDGAVGEGNPPEGTQSSKEKPQLDFEDGDLL
jgi:hypothetical protein